MIRGEKHEIHSRNLKTRFLFFPGWKSPFSSSWQFPFFTDAADRAPEEGASAGDSGHRHLPWAPRQSSTDQPRQPLLEGSSRGPSPFVPYSSRERSRP